MHVKLKQNVVHAESMLSPCFCFRALLGSNHGWIVQCKASGEGITDVDNCRHHEISAQLKHCKFPWMQCCNMRVREFVHSFCLVTIVAAVAVPHEEGLT